MFHLFLYSKFISKTIFFLVGFHLTKKIFSKGLSKIRINVLLTVLLSTSYNNLPNKKLMNKNEQLNRAALNDSKCFSTQIQLASGQGS